MTTKFGKAFLRCGSTGRGCLSAVKKRRIDQLDLRLKELDSQPESKAVAPSSPGDQSGDAPCTAALPDHLPRESRKYPPKQEACPDLWGELKHLGEDISEILEYVPDHFKVIRQVRRESACAGCERIVQAQTPSRPIERNFAGPGLLESGNTCWSRNTATIFRCIASRKFTCGKAVDLDRSTLADWIGGAGYWNR